jgi:hypothetical protein
LHLPREAHRCLEIPAVYEITIDKIPVVLLTNQLAKESRKKAKEQ